MAKYRPINRGKKIIISLITVVVLFGGTYSVSAILGGGFPKTVGADPLPTSDAPIPSATGASVASDPGSVAPSPTTSSPATTSSSPGSSATAGSSTAATSAGTTASEASADPAASAASEDPFAKKCREQFEQEASIVGSLLGRVFCFIGDKVGYALAKMLEYAFDIKNIVASRDNPEINQFLKGRSGWAYVVWRGLTQLANILGVLVLIIVAFANILRLNLNTYAVKRMLPLLIGALIAANTSWLFIGLVYGMSNQVIPDSMYSAIISGIDGLLQSLMSIIAPLFLLIPIAPLIAIVIGVIFLGLFIVMTILGLILTFQPIIVSAIAMFAPAMIMCAVLPQTQKAFNKWLQILVNWIIMWPLTMLILYAVSVIIGLANVGKITATILKAMFAWLTPGVTVKQSVAEIAGVSAPIFVCVALFAFAIRIPFMLGKDAVALANGAKDGAKALMGLGIGGLAVGGSALQRGKELVGKQVVGRLDTWGSRYVEGGIKGWFGHGVKAQVAKAEAEAGGSDENKAKARRKALVSIINQGSGSRWGLGREGARIAANLLREDQQTEHTKKQEEERARHLDKIKNIESSNENDAMKKYELKREEEEHEKEKARISLKYDPDAGLEHLKEREQIRIALQGGKTVGQLDEDERHRADLAAMQEWAGLEKGNGDKEAEALLAVYKGVDDKGTYRDIAKKIATGETEGKGSAVVNSLMKWLSLGNLMSIGENALDATRDREANLKKLRREMFLGTKAFEMLAGEQVAGSTVVGEYAEKYRYWQYPELLQEVRRLSRNLSPDQIARLIEQSPRKAWPMARQIGYKGNLDDFSKLYMASNFLKSAGRSYGASATFSEMLTTGEPAYEIQQRKRRSSGLMPAMGTYAGPEVDVVRDLDGLGELIGSAGGSSSPEAVKLAEASLEKLSGMMGDTSKKISEDTIYNTAAAFGTHLSKNTSEQMDAMDAIRNNREMDVNKKIQGILASAVDSRGGGGVNSADFTQAMTRMEAVASAFQRTAEGMQAGQLAGQRLTRQATEAMLRKPTPPPVQPSRSNPPPSSPPPTRQ
ncbi:MAG TPA: hypothetical protein PLX55_02915 [bacterium]|nr:hypothetical protein [bacterium]